MSAADSSDKTIKGILTKLGLIMGFILIVPGIMSNVLDIDPIDGCVKLTTRDAEHGDVGSCWRDVKAPVETDDNGKETEGKQDKLIKAKVAFDRDVIGLVSWALTAFMLIMVVVGFVFPGRDIISYMRSNTEDK